MPRLPKEEPEVEWFSAALQACYRLFLAGIVQVEVQRATVAVQRQRQCVTVLPAAHPGATPGLGASASPSELIAEPGVDSSRTPAYVVIGWRER